MSDDEIEEIRARHNYTEEMWWTAEDPCANQAHADRAALLAEVERLREVISTLEIVGKAADDERQTMRKRIEQLHEIIENNGVPCVIRRLL